MRKKLLLVISLVLICSICLKSQDEQNLDGTVWNSFSTDEKHQFFNGFSVGVLRVADLVNKIKDACKKNKEKSYGKAREIAAHHVTAIEILQRVLALHIAEPSDFDQIMKGLDNFYKDNANKHIYIYHAIEIVQKRMRGVAKEDIEELIQKYKRTELKK